MLSYIILYYKVCLQVSTYYKVILNPLEHIADTDNHLFKCLNIYFLF